LWEAKRKKKMASPPTTTASVTVRPRLQRESWSLYWRESMATETAMLPDVDVAVSGLPPDATVRDALAAAAAKCGWPAASALVRLEGFELPFERCLVRGVEVGLDEPVAKFAAAAVAQEKEEKAGGEAKAGGGGSCAPKPPAPPLVYVRTTLAAEGWRLANDPDDPAGYSTSDTDDSSEEGA
jgi:hypothetical protein